MNEQRTYGVTLNLLDLKAQSAAAFAEYVEHHGSGDEKWEYTGLEPGFEPYAYVTAPDGRHYVICNEGVGWEISEDKPLRVDLYLHGKARDDDGTMFGAMPTAAMILTMDEVLAAQTGEHVDLADHVRVFGSRLEENFETWHARLTS